MASRAYLHQLVDRVFGTQADKWLDTPNPQFTGKPKPRDLVDCPDCSDMVLRYLESLSTDKAVKRAQHHITQPVD